MNKAKELLFMEQGNKLCSHCKEEINSKATRCPHCQGKQKKHFYKSWIFWIIAVPILLSVVLTSLNDANEKVELQKLSEQQTQQKQINYEILEHWAIPNGGEGKKILISKEYLNDSDMTALGNKLKQDVSGDRNAMIQVYTDKKAAELRDKVLADQATSTENDLYDKNYVGWYKKNGNTGLHQFDIFFDGVMGTNKKTIKY